MPTVEVKIWLALKSRIDSLPLTFSKAWPAETFTVPHSGNPPTLQPYIRIGTVTVDPLPVQIATGKPHVRTGTLILTLVHPLRSGYTMPVYNQYGFIIPEKGSEHNEQKTCICSE